MTDQLPPVLRADEMREADRRTIESLGMPGFTLMEIAGRAVADEALLMVDEDELGRIACLCGKGNNGGDGFVAARVLHQAGFEVDVFTTCPSSELAGDALEHYRVLARIADSDHGIRIRTIGSADDLQNSTETTLYIDALLGTGLSKNVREPVAGIIGWLNEQKIPVLSVDLPSGLHSDNGQVLGCAVNADVTVTMGALKQGLLIGDGPDYSGAVVVAEIGIPNHILTDVFESGLQTFLCQPQYVQERLPVRKRDSHKYATGPTLVFGGSDEFTGAPVLSATAAMRMGSGYVVAVCPESIREILAEKLTEIPVSAIQKQGVSWDFDGTLDALDTRWTKAKSILIGPGIGRNPGMKEMVLGVLKRAKAPVVVDADGLYALIGEHSFVEQYAGGNWIFTPHAGEFQRLADGKNDAGSLIDSSRAFAKKWNVVLLLKGMPSVTAAPDGRVMINDTGNPAVATAGSGDVLSGMVAGLLAQGLDPFDAAVASIHAGGAIADHYASTRSVNSMMATDVLSLIPDYLSNQI